MGVMAEMIHAVQHLQSAPNQNLPIHLIVSQPQARRYFDPKQLDKLKRSIQQVGILQPLLVVPQPGTPYYRLIAGERRYRAAQMADLKTVPVIILNLQEWNEAKLQSITLLENLQRQDLNKFEETQAIIELIALEFNRSPADIPTWLMRLENYNKSSDTHNVMGNSEKKQEVEEIEQFFERLGLMTWKAFVKNRLPLLHLPDNVRDALLAGRISYTVALALKRIKDDQVRNHWLSEAEAGVGVRRIHQVTKVSPTTPWERLRSRIQRLNWEELHPDIRGVLEQKTLELLELLPSANRE